LSNKYFLKSFFAVSLLASLGLGFFFSELLAIKNVVVKTDSEDKIKTQYLDQKNLLTLDLEKEKAKIKEEHPLLEHLELRKVYPNTLFVSYTQIIPAAQIKNNGEYLLISASGKIAGKKLKKSANLLNLTYYQKIRYFQSQLGQEIGNQDILYGIKAGNRAKEFDYQIEEIMIKKPGVITIKLTPPLPLIIFSQKKSVAKSWAIVHNIIRSCEEREQKPKVINLLFDKPIYNL